MFDGPPDVTASGGRSSPIAAAFGGSSDNETEFHYQIVGDSTVPSRSLSRKSSGIRLAF